MGRSRTLGSLSAALLGGGAVACGGGAALLHPAHVLPAAKLSAGAGMSGQFSFGRGADAITRGGAATGPQPVGDPETAFFEGAVSKSSLAPGLAPWVGARVGLGGDNEGGLTYTGRTARVDARHAFSDDTMALSIGAGASAVLMHPPAEHGAGTPQDVGVAGRFVGGADQFTATGYGFDVPVVLGLRSTASIVEGWIGLRGGVEHIAGTLDVVGPGMPITNVEQTGRPHADITALRAYGGGLVGASIGLTPFSVALELDVAYQSISGKAVFPAEAGGPSESRATISALTVSPAGAIIGKF